MFSISEIVKHALKFSWDILFQMRTVFIQVDMDLSHLSDKPMKIAGRLFSIHG